MIGQLQSNLVKKKNIFLKACGILSMESEDCVSFEEFSQLDHD